MSPTVSRPSTEGGVTNDPRNLLVTGPGRPRRPLFRAIGLGGIGRQGHIEQRPNVPLRIVDHVGNGPVRDVDESAHGVLERVKRIPMLRTIPV